MIFICEPTYTVLEITCCCDFWLVMMSFAFLVPSVFFLFNDTVSMGVFNLFFPPSAQRQLKKQELFECTLTEETIFLP